MSHQFSQRQNLLLLALIFLLQGCGGGNGGGNAGTPEVGSSNQALASPEAVDTGWLSSRTATQALMPTAIAGNYLKGRDWALAVRDNVANATSYTATFSGRGWYVDPELGDDQAPGTQARPWKSLQRVAAGTYAAGDAILLRCGKVFRESLDLTSNAAPSGGVLLAGYGDCTGGKRPVISGADLLPSTGWTNPSSGADPIWSHALSSAPSRVFFDGRPLLMARHPNTRGIGQEFSRLRANGTQRNQFFLSAEDTSSLAGKDLLGAVVHVRVAAWDIETATVTGHDPSTGLITLNRSLDHAIKDDAGYLMEGKSWMLDSPGEWWFDSASGRVQIWGPNSESGSAFTRVEASSRATGVRVRWVSNLTVAWLQTQQHAETGFSFTETDGLRLNGVNSQFDMEHGIQVLTANDVGIEASNVTAAGWMGILVRDGNQVRVTQNQVTDTGLFDRPDSTDGAIAVLSTNAEIADNVVYRSANVGIRFLNSPGNQVRDNLIVAFCLRLTDCGGIYTFTSAYPAAPASAYSPAASVHDNVLFGARSNTEGLGSEGKNMAAGIFLDELTAGAEVRNNYIADTEVGVHLHDAAFNVIAGNVIRSVSHAGIRGVASRTDVNALKGNRISGNNIGYFTSLSELPGGEATGRDRSYVQLWYHPNDPQALFSGVSPNVSELNQTVGVQSLEDVRWRLVKSGGEWVLDAAGWQAIAPQDSHRSSLLYRNYLVTTSGSSLIANGNFQQGTSQWEHYLNPMGTGGFFLAGALAECPSQPCAHWAPAMTGDNLTSAPFTLNATPGQNLYLVRLTVTGGVGGGHSKVNVRRRVAPYENYGFGFTGTSLAQGETASIEQFFRATGTTDAVLDLKTQVGGQSFYRNASVLKVSAIELPNSAQLIGQFHNVRDNAASFTCTMLALSTCDVIDENGQTVAWPLTLPARSSMSVYARDNRWLRP